MRLELPAPLQKSGENAYSVCGQGTPLVLIHGVGMRQQVWAPQVQDLARDFQVITWDMPGHGQSGIPPEGVQLAHYAEQLRKLLDHLDVERAHVVGHSMGALVALEFALTWPQRCLRVAALNAVFCRTPEQRAAVIARAESLATSGIESTLDATLARWFEPASDPDIRQIPAQVREFLLQVNPDGYRRTYELFARSDRAHETRLQNLQPPALFMTGELDANSRPEMSQAMAALAPDARVDILPGARHMMPLTHAPEVNRRLRAFLGGRHNTPP